MKNLLLLIFAALVSLPAGAQNNGSVVVGTIDSIQSKVLNEQRKIWVYLPQGKQNPSGNRYPVIYLLDGTFHFLSVAGMLQQFSQVNGNTLCPEMIVVGIVNTDRTRDLTPTHVAADPPYMDSTLSKTSGGGEQFLSFVEKELIPYIDSHYPTQPYRMLIGHSFGGLMAIHSMMYHTRLFNAYISIDPSMWWEDMSYLKRTKEMLQQKKFTGVSLYLAYAHTLAEGMDAQKAENDTSRMTRHFRAIRSIDRAFQDKKDSGLRYGSKYYGSETHTTAPLIAEHDALRFIFSRYQFKSSTKDYTDPDVDIAGKYENHVNEVSQFLGYRVLPAENFVQGWAAEFFRIKQYAKAGKLYALTVKYYPESVDAHQSMGDF